MVGDGDREVCAVSDRETCCGDVGDCAEGSEAERGAAVMVPARRSGPPQTGPLAIDVRRCVLLRWNDGRKGVVESVADCSGAESDE